MNESFSQPSWRLDAASGPNAPARTQSMGPLKSEIRLTGVGGLGSEASEGPPLAAAPLGVAEQLLLQPGTHVRQLLVAPSIASEHASNAICKTWKFLKAKL